MRRLLNRVHGRHEPGGAPGFQRLRRIRGEAGGSLVETAFSISLLMMVVFGCIVMSMALYAYHYVSEAARDGTRYLIVRGSACTNFPTACPAGSTDAQTYLRTFKYPGINTSNLTATTSWSVYPAGGTCTPSATCNNPGNLVTVTVTYPITMRVPFGINRTFNVTSTSAMIISN